jgi:hypothetical protein
MKSNPIQLENSDSEYLRTMAKYALRCNLSKVGHVLCEIVITIFNKNVAEIPGDFFQNLQVKI